MTTHKIAVLGTVGVPASYGGFETLAENLVRYCQGNRTDVALGVFCSSHHYERRPAEYFGAKLHYIGLPANGASSILYDIASLASAIHRGYDTILLLGVSGAVALPIVRLFSSARIVTNIDGIEWRREKWRGAAKLWLRWSEKLAVRFSHRVVADNQGIADYVMSEYGMECAVIAYGGDHAVATSEGPEVLISEQLPTAYSLALCRIEPENNVAMILAAFKASGDDLVFVGNWESSTYGRHLLEEYGDYSNIRLLNPIYDAAKLLALRRGARLYVHGHSAGGTNPSLVEMMHFGIPILAFDCIFNRCTTEGAAAYFRSAADLQSKLGKLSPQQAKDTGVRMLEIAQARYTWDSVGRDYLRLLAPEGSETT